MVTEYGPGNESFFILDSLPIGAFVLRADYSVVFWNRTLESWTGYPTSAVCSQQISDLFPKLGERLYRNRLSKIFKGGPPIIFTSKLHKNLFPFTLPGGQVRVVEMVASAVLGHEKGDFFALCALQDVSDLTHRVTSYQRVSKELQRLDQLKNEFISILSHDLRTPVGSMGSAATTLLDGYVGKVNLQQREILGIIERSSNFLLKMIADLLDLSRIESGILVQNSSPMDIRNVLKFALKSISKENLSLNFLVPRQAVDVRLDKDRMVQAVQNLLGNATRFAESRIDLILKTKADNALVFVEDDGPGIPPEDLEKIFIRYERSRKHRSKSQTGLGLGIVRAIADGHGGGVYAENMLSGDGQIRGARFVMTLPLAPKTNTGP